MEDTRSPRESNLNREVMKTAGDKQCHIDKELISLREIAELWHCDRTTVARILQNAGIKSYVLTNKRNGTKRYAKSDVDAFMASRFRKRTLSSILE